MSRVDSDAMQRYEQARDELVARLFTIEKVLSDRRRAAVHAAGSRLARGKFVLAVLGEFSSGKSFLLNALLGKFGLLATDINPSTATITELEYGLNDEATAQYEDGRTERIPLDALDRVTTADPADAPLKVVVKIGSPFLQRGFMVADTPGLASVDPAHRRATLQFLPTADAVLYLIDTQQPFSEGDASFLGIVRRHIDTIFIVQTKIDLWTALQSDGRTAWQHAGDRIARMAALHAPGTYVYALSARQYVDATLAGDAAAVEASRFPAFLAALDASLIKRTGRARLRRAGEVVAIAANDEIDQIDGDLAMLALDPTSLADRRAAVVPDLQRLDEEAKSYREELSVRCAESRRALALRAQTLAEDVERALSQAFDIADVARLRDRERLHLVVDRVMAQVAGEFAHYAAATAVDDLDAASARASVRLPLRWSLNDEAAHAFGAQPGTSLWSGDAATAIAATIVLEAIGGPAIALVGDIATRFAGRPPGGYMKRELVADLRADIFPRLTVEIASFAGAAGARIGQLYDALARAIAQAAATKRDADLGSIERALHAHANGDADAVRAAATLRRKSIESEAAEVARVVDSFMAHDEEIAPADPGSDVVRAAHAEPSFDSSSYERGLRPERWRVGVLGAIGRGKSSLINAFAGRRVLDDPAGTVRFPIHVRYGEREAAYALAPDGEWREIAFASAVEAAAETAVLVLVPWTLPRQLVLVHAPAFDSGDPDAADVNVAVAGRASEVLCLFSRQLSDRELDLYERIAEFGRPMLFAHTIADNESASERRHVVELARDYLKARSIAAERVFTVSANEYAQARNAGRAPAPWNEMEALRSTLEAHAESHMARLERLERARETIAVQHQTPSTPSSEGNFLTRLFGKGRRAADRRIDAS